MKKLVTLCLGIAAIGLILQFFLSILATIPMYIVVLGVLCLILKRF